VAPVTTNVRPRWAATFRSLQLVTAIAYDGLRMAFEAHLARI